MNTLVDSWNSSSSLQAACAAHHQAGLEADEAWECGRGELANAARGGSEGWRAHRLRFVLFCSGTYIAVAARWAVALVVFVHAQRRHLLPARSLAMGVRDTAAALEIGALRLCYAVPNPTGRVPVLLSASYPVPQGVRLVVEVSPVAQRRHVLPLVVGWPPPARLGMLRAPAGGSALARGGYRRLRQKVDGGRSGKGAGGGGCKWQGGGGGGGGGGGDGDGDGAGCGGR